MSCYAIVLGVDKYKNIQDLPSCEKDAELIEKFLLSTGKYTVLRIPNSTSKYEIQEKIKTFLPNDGSDISEVLFYFSGHGKQDEQGMHYALLETDINKINSTSLNNSELDDIIRKSSPKLYVKIIDACQSGLTYIKGIEPSFNEQEFDSAKGFQNCFFMCSSLNSQSSYAGAPYSEFTQAIIDSIKSIQAPIVKFTDVQNYLSDVFQCEGFHQTPYFNTQCDGTEIFCEKNEGVMKFIAEYEKANSSDDNSSADSDIDTINTYLEKCKNESEVKAIMEGVMEIIQKWSLSNSLLRTFYDISCESKFPYIYHKHHEEPSIVKTLYSKAANENLFVQIECESVQKESILINPFYRSYKDVPIAYHSLAHNLPGVFSVHFKAKNANLPDYVVPFIFVYSPTFFYNFTCTKQFLRKAWDEYEEGQHTKYVYSKFEYNDYDATNWEEYLEKRMEEYLEFIEKTLKEYVAV